MEILNFGENSRPVILFFQGSMTHWSWYEQSIDKLSKKFHVIVPILKGHNNKPEDGDFISVEDTVEDVEKFLLEIGKKEVLGAYGLSIGGAIITSMLANSKIKIKKVIIDGGITPYRYPYFITRLILLRDFLGMKLIQNSKTVLKHFMKFDGYNLSKDEIEQFYDEILVFLKSISNRTIINIFDSANNYKMPEIIPKLDTDIGIEIEYWYGEKEKKDRKLDIKYISSIFPNTKFFQIDGMEHGEFVTMKPLEFSLKAISFFEKV